jgi:membrane fusion protein (multidrug efflux system)
MDQTTQSPLAATADRPRNDSPRNAAPESRTQPLPSTERDFRTRPSRTNSPGFRIAVGVAAVVLLVAGVLVYRYVASYESTDDAEVDGHINSISTRISGHVVKLNVLDNQSVQAGALLVEIDPADYQVAYDRAKADFESAQASAAEAGVDVPITSVNTSSQLSATQADVESSRAGIAAAKQQFEAAKAQLDQAEANNVKAQNDLVRYKQLVDKQEIS